MGRQGGGAKRAIAHVYVRADLDAHPGILSWKEEFAGNNARGPVNDIGS